MQLKPPCCTRQTPLNTCKNAAPQSLPARLTTAAHQAATAAALAATLLAASPATAITTEQLLYLEAWRAVDRAYVDKTFNNNNWFKVREDVLKKKQLDTRQQTYDAISTSLSLLDDPFTRLLDPGRYAALQRGTGGGAITGVGLEVAFEEGKGAASELVVVTPAPGGPADTAGIKPGDVIAAIDGRPTRGLSLYEAADLLQGAEGTEATLSLRRARGQLQVVALTRARLAVKPVLAQLCGDGVAYVRIAAFAKNTTPEMRGALGALRAAGARAYVIDLRNNGGGYFPSSVEVGRMLIQGGDIVLIADSDGVRDVYGATGDALLPSAPLSVLINQGTGSAAEVLAGALKDNKRAVLVGETTFGKGLIQTVVPLSDGSAVAVTVARYQTPSGVDINKKGIAPDVERNFSSLPFDPPRVCAALDGGLLN